MSTPMTQEGLITWLTSRGWTIKDIREEQNKRVGMISSPMGDMRRGISFWAMSTTGYTLSIQAGNSLYSTPRAYAEEYTAVEIAIWKSRENGTKNGSYIKDVVLTGGQDVGSWVDYDKIMVVIHTMEDWKDGKGPQSVMKREDPIWPMED